MSNAICCLCVVCRLWYGRCVVVQHAKCSFVMCEGQVTRFQETRFSETESLRVQFKLIVL